MSAFHTRPYHAFLSYSHKDSEVARALHRWLETDAGFRIWFDENHLEAGSPVAARLAEQMSQCRGWLVLSSKDALASTWVRAERDQALHCLAQTPEFVLLNLRIDDCNIDQTWPALARFSWLDSPNGELTVATARQIIDRFDRRVWSGRQHDLRDIYVSRGWRPADLPVADTICQRLCDRQFRLRLVGDARDHTTFSADRVADLMSGCCAHLTILPARGAQGSPSIEDYKYFVRELDLSERLGIPQLLLADPGVALPAPLDGRTTRVDTTQLAATFGASVPEWLERFIEDLTPPPTPQHHFLAAEFGAGADRASRLREFIEAASGIPCAIGRDFEGQGLRGRIAESISSASVVIANLARSESGDPLGLAVNVNTCVEAGIAIGASQARTARGDAPIPIFLLAHAPLDETQRTARLPFMFRDSQVTWYSTEAEMIAHCRRILYPFRRRIMNYEFAREGEAGS